MCGIVGVFGDPKSVRLVQQALRVMQNRGHEAFGITDLSRIETRDSLRDLPSWETDNCIGQNLDALVNKVPQPLHMGNSFFVANCEVYNWKELSSIYDLQARNDADMIFKLLEKVGLEKALSLFDGPFAFAWYKDGKLTLARDILGIKPLFYFHDGQNFYFATESKVLRIFGISYPVALIPRKTLTFNLETRSISETLREFFSVKPPIKDSKDMILIELSRLLERSLEKRIPDLANPKTRRFGILFSGGVDSTLLAYLCKKRGYDFMCYTAAVDDPAFAQAKDLIAARNVAHRLDLNLKIAKVKLDKVEKYLAKVCPLIESNNVVKVGVALPFYLACEIAKKDGIKVILSGLGSEEIFAGYERHLRAIGVHDVNEECLSGLLQMHERDLYRDDVVTMDNNIEVRMPFLDKELVSYALRIPGKYKISKEQKKIILRETAVHLGLDEDIAFRPKQAAQYGSKFDRAISKLAARAGFESKSEYLRHFYTEPELRLGSLLSSGKDSVYATYVMRRQNYEISCFLTIESDNQYSFMFHTPNARLAKLQAEAAGIPLLVGKTKGEEEKELDDLRDLLARAKDKYHIEGIVVGALFSTYQRNRVEKVADQVGLRVFAPLWHKDQSDYMHELLSNRFCFIVTAVAAEGLGREWLGKVIEKKDIDKLDKLSLRFGINVAGEGGEYETFVVDCPMFSRRIEVIEADIIMDSEHSGRFEIKVARLVDK